MKGAPRSKEFDDVYFSAEDGLAETEHVFLDGNNLPAAWQGKKRFTICELGFGTGLNFLAAWKRFEESCAPDQTLHFISIEKYPLSQEEIENALKPFAETFERQLPEYLSNYPYINAKRIVLEVYFEDISTALPKIEPPIDAWFLDGFKPSTNPDMWSEDVFQTMAHLSHPGTTFATFTAAGFVRRGLQNAGFDIKKIPGFGSKREMSVGRYGG